MLLTAYRLAISPVNLPEVLVDHLGIRDPADLSALHKTSRTATWEKRCRSRVLWPSRRQPPLPPGRGPSPGTPYRRTTLRLRGASRRSRFHFPMH
ncbi:hypothetical protein [Actinokineospora iranica]